jgi:diguanylate cyclase (GGDEF)-like protein/PAS domain S-box-containing protein
MSKSPQGAESATPPATALRKQAEEIFREKAARLPKNRAALSSEEAQQALHELRVHQIELEIQNEELRWAQAELDAARARYFDLYDLAPVGYCTISEKGLILEANLTATTLLGTTRFALVRQPLTRFILKEDQDIHYLHRKQLFETGEPQAYELRMVKKDGTIFSAYLAATIVQDAGDEPGCRIVLSDITERKQTEKKLQYLSMHDVLTGLYNRRYFEESMERLERGRQFPISILMADVNNLKIVNDRRGYVAGDSLLKSVAHLLTVSFRAEDVIARLGGDEFAVLMPGTTAAAAEGALLRFRQILQEHNTACADTSIRLSCGIGTSETRDPLIETLKKADANMYLEKQGQKVAAKPDRLAEEASLSSSSGQALRRRAEETSRKKAGLLPENLAVMSPEEARQTLHELRVYQVELEMQNEELRRAQAELEGAWARYFSLYDHAPVGYITFSEQGLILETNLTAAGLLGVPQGALVNQLVTVFIFKEDQDIFYLHRKQLFETHAALRLGSVQASSLLHQGVPLRESASAGQVSAPQSRPGEQARAACELRMVKQDGTIFWTQLETTAAADEDDVPVGRAVLSDITERKLAEEALRESERRYKRITEGLTDYQYTVRVESGRAAETRQSPACATVTGYTAEELAADPYLWFRMVVPEDREQVQERVQRILTGNEIAPIEHRIVRKDGEMRWVRDLVILNKNAAGKLVSYDGVIKDITERKQAEKDKAKLEAQLRQAQKMESVGRLAGGVAHDFNNMLSVILGYTELSLMHVDPAQPLYGDLIGIRKAAERAADLTRQLLAFARKQTIAPKVLNLNETVKGILKMLQRIIGEDIRLNWQPEAGLWPVKVDPSQIDQLLANLCVNARDAIADVGKITIEMGNSTLDAAYCADHPGFVAGEYVRLAVSDDGCGMDSEILDKLFEPFFTTKELGKGTGLGLATVYGIVKQNNGFINVDSAPGLGTTFTIYLPRHVGEVEQATRTEGAAGPALRGRETILLVEDEPAVLSLTTLMLEKQGYTVLAASLPDEATRLAREHADKIHLLMTDVIMPEMNGRDLAKNLRSLYPDLKCLFMSGYTADLIAHHGVLDQGVHFIQKPITMKELTAKVREALGRG